MSLYDKASLVFSSKAAAGKDGKAYNIKPVEKLKVDELVTNGDFSYDGDWTEGTGWSISNGKATKTAGTAANLHPSYDMNLDNNKHYKVTYTISGRTAGQIRVKLGNSGYGEYRSADGTYSEVIKPVVTTFDKLQFNTDSTFAGSIDNVSVKEVEQKAVDFTMVRGSNLTATREAPSGLIEKGRENLVEYSNDFSKWTYNPNVHNAPVSGQTGYDGSTDAWLIDKVASDNSYLVLPTPFNYTGVFTWSMYAKNESGANNGLHMYTPAGQAKFDLTGSGSVVSPSYANISATIESIGSGWFRCSFAADGTFTTTNQPRFKVVDTAGDNSTGKIYVQDTQLEQGLVATPYIHTTDSYSKKTAGVLENEPRYDYSGGDAVLLLEPERQNKFIHSEYLASSSIFKTNSSFTTNQGTSPEGLNNAAKMNEGSASGNLPHNFYYSGIQNSKTYTISFYAKKVDRDHVYVNIYSGVDSKFVFYDLSDGTVATTSLGDVTASISDAGSGWYRISYTRDTASTGSPNFRIGMSSANGTVDYQGNGSETLFYGVQWEEGSYATSYIPTYGSAATREGEGDTLSSFSCELDKPLSKKYTIFVDLQVDNLERPTTNFDDIFVARAADGNNYAFRLEGYHDPTPDPDTYSLRVFAYSTKDSRAALSSDHSNGIQLGQRNKIAIVFDDTVGVKVFLNGNSTPLKEVLVGGSFSTFPTETLQANSFYDVKFLEGGSQPRSKTLLHGVQAYDVALSDAECVSLTTI